MNLKKLITMAIAAALVLASKNRENELTIEVNQPETHPTFSGCSNMAAWAAIDALSASAKTMSFDSQRKQAASDICAIAQKHPEIASRAIRAMSEISKTCDFDSSKREISSMITKLV
jgi:hypothetical protein